MHEATEAVEEFFDNLADQWDSMSEHSEASLGELLSLSGIRMGERVLDVGTGTGVLVPLLLSMVGTRGSVDAMDISSEMLRVARAKHSAPNLSFVKSPAEAMPYEDDTFHHIVIFSCFPHLSDRRKALEESRRVLRPGGSLLIAHNMGRHRLNSIHKEAGSAVESHRLPPASEVAVLAESVGMQPVLLLDEESRFAVVARKPPE